MSDNQIIILDVCKKVTQGRDLVIWPLCSTTFVPNTHFDCLTMLHICWPEFAIFLISCDSIHRSRVRPVPWNVPTYCLQMVTHSFLCGREFKNSFCWDFQHIVLISNNWTPNTHLILERPQLSFIIYREKAFQILCQNSASVCSIDMGKCHIFV